MLKPYTLSIYWCQVEVHFTCRISAISENHVLHHLKGFKNIKRMYEDCQTWNIVEMYVRDVFQMYIIRRSYIRNVFGTSLLHCFDTLRNSGKNAQTRNVPLTSTWCIRADWGGPTFCFRHLTRSPRLNWCRKTEIYGVSSFWIS